MSITENVKALVSSLFSHPSKDHGITSEDGDGPVALPPEVFRAWQKKEKEKGRSPY